MQEIWILRTNDFKETVLTDPVQNFVKSEIIIKALKQLALYWSIAAVCILIPLLHFFLVPLFLMLGLFKGYRSLHNKRKITKCDYICPQCKQMSSLRNIYFESEARVNCNQCLSQLVLLQKNKSTDNQ
jgi:hypothetical protein